MKFELNDYKKELTDDEILSDIKAVAKQLGKSYISISTYKKYGRFSQTAIQGHFGTWKKALSLSGLRTERNASELKHISDEDYFADLQKVAQIMEKDTVSYDDYKRCGKYSAEHIFHRFGKWSVALELAGLNTTGFSKDRITKQECFDEIERIWRLLGRQPTSTDIMKSDISKYSIDTFRRRFGGWRAALEEFVEYINDTDDEDISKGVLSENPVLEKTVQTFSAKKESIEKNSQRYVHRTSRNISTRLRFIVMKRDNFKCLACGASPAKDPAVELHIDHIIPWSKGGETVIDNLQTLCSKCNLGKSDML